MTIRITAMPSPNHTNRAGLFMGVLGRPAAAFAADNGRRRRAHDAAISDALSALQIFLNQKLTNPDDQRQAETLVTALLNAAPDDDGADPDDADQTAEDRRRKMAGDQNRRVVSELAKRFPNARMPRQA